MTRTEAPVTPPVVLTIAGSDSGGGAGIQADLKTIEAGGAFGTSAITSVTAQNTTGVESTHVLPTDEIAAQCGAVRSDFDVAAIKTGMLATSDVIDIATDAVRNSDAPAVVDPVMVASSGDRLLEPAAEAAYEDLIAESTLVTPNADEAEVLTDIEVTDSARAQQAAEQLVEMGADAALVKGGHVPGDDIVDVLATGDSIETVRHTRVDTEATHGSGCTLSAAIATRLAHGDDLTVAVRTGIDLLARAVRYNLDVGEGPGAVHHMVAARDQAERDPTAERVAEVVRQFVRRDVSRLVPEVGLNVVGATPYAEVPTECAAVEGRITRTLDGVAANRGVRFGASTNVARFLLAAREFDSDLRFAVNCRVDDEIEAALDALDGTVAEYDPANRPPEAEGQTVEWAATQAFEASDTTPVAIAGRAGVGWEPTVVVLAPDSATLADRTIGLLDAVTDEE
ncbi:bifunctional hydroxymethylpyrimidine kinase/phosphomethylpyrimidine kinase [Salinibaculum rarum]|uniref:bifunctional hydroxymethylpyrimidine kinase/phosphomethylpyrimidine kinase n=1 Tax=Salinibaculum rarum TaxID=3058903 RepID=UPI00265EA815|nr:bifunctional hydroxymethylpyrimidine kinase/phosphomethylpyrimidine kinase [Salinibaculum sp. KK48]